MRLHDVSAVIHLHSTYSDGSGTVAEIARAGQRAGVDVVMLTDHDTLAARDSGEEGWYDDTLLLVGHEISPSNNNHCLAFGLDQVVEHTGLGPAEIVDEVKRREGLAFIAHPFSRGSKLFKRAGKGMPWAAIDHPSFDGIELWSFVTDTFESMQSYADIPRFLRRPNDFVDHPPAANVTEWDRLCQARPVVAIGGLDAHQAGKRVGRFVPIKLMAYHRSFATLRTHLLLTEPLTRDVHRDEKLVLSALREGRCYLAMDSLAEAKGFAFSAQSGGEDTPMGSEAKFSDQQLLVRLPSAARRIRILKNGEQFGESEGDDQLAIPSDGPGVYRAEATLWHRGCERTWVMSNPVYLRKAASTPESHIVV